jgi:hypothetical protein
MKVFVIFDNQGRIKGTAATQLDNVAVGTPQQLRVHTVPRAEIDEADLPRYLADLHANHRVDILGEPRIVRKRNGKRTDS